MAQKRANKTVRSLITLLILVAILGTYYYAITGNNPIYLVTKEGEAQHTISDMQVRIQRMLGHEPSPTPVATTASGEWWEVYFTDPAHINDSSKPQGSIEEKLIDKIKKSEKSIHIASFEFNLDPVATALIDAHKRGVDVRWVTDNEHGIEADSEEGHGQFAQLEKAGIEVKDDSRGALMHNKFWIFDGGTVLTGSTNITKNGIFRNNNNVIVIKSPELATIYEREFDEMWAGEFGPTSPSTVDEQKLSINKSPVQVLFASEDDVADHLVTILKAANYSIRFMAFSFTQDDMGNAIIERSKHGVDVMGIFENTGSETKYSELARLYNAGLPMRQDTNKGIFHHKVIIIDGKTVVTGSFNFSDNANKSNDENVLIISNKAIADEYLKEFERRWQESKDPDPAKMKQIVS
ncbi:hypothetical protein JW960_21910 [candidate division KSB1 bacterium]|nr:hypothetical protein [candidate division KSB1 bacterium]